MNGTETRITRTKKLLSVRNCWQANDFYLVYYRLYSPDNSRYYSLRFVISIDLTDIPDDESYDDYMNDTIYAISGDFDYENAAAAIQICNETIQNYNS